MGAERASAERPLAGVGVLVTRPRDQAEPLCRLIEQAGGTAIRFPALEIAPPQDVEALDRLIDRLDEFDIAIFISPNAVNRAMNRVRARRGSLPARLTVACVGRGSARELKHFGIGEPLVPTGRFDSEALLALPALQAVAGKRVVILRGDGGRELLGETLKARGAVVEYAECYRRVRPAADVGGLLKRWARGEIDVVTLTSVEALRNLYDMLGKLGAQWLIKTPAVVASERIAAACSELGFKHPPVVAERASDEALVEALKAWRAAQNSL